MKNPCRNFGVALAFAYWAVSCSGPAFAAGGTAIVASPGSKASVSPAWPENVEDLVNDPARTTGYNAWFSEWPNDVNQYAFEIATMDDVNRLVRKLAAVKAPLRQIRLSPLKEPEALGWVTRLPKGNNVAVVFSIGDQARIDQWFGRVRKPFGKMKFLAAPVAVPPTLTIFVQHDAVKLDELMIPEGVSVSRGYVPTLFHRANTDTGRTRSRSSSAKPRPPANPTPLGRPPRKPSTRQRRRPSKRSTLFSRSIAAPSPPIDNRPRPAGPTGPQKD